MAQIFRVERTKNFTVMSNHHFKNKKLTLKAKGLLSLMLSLSDDWNYTEISGKNTQAENGKTEAILRESRNARRNSEVKRRNSSFDNRNVRNVEVESIGSAEQRRFEEQKRFEEQERARAA